MENAKIRSFGRTKGRKLSGAKSEKLEKILPNYLIKTEDNIIKNLPQNCDKMYFEIGFGYGEHTLHQAQLNPNYGIIAAETYANGISSLLDKIEENNIKNIRIFDWDARDLLEKMPNHSLDKVFILFPDPWPKKRQNKKRIINEDFLDLIRLKLKSDGTLFVASDILGYVIWIIESVRGKFRPLFSSLTDSKKVPDWWITTRYQEKAIKDGRNSYFMEFAPLSSSDD